jgi:iron(III) transport system permease protein
MILIAFRSAAVVLGAALIAVAIGSTFALATFGRSRFLSRFQVGIVSSTLLLPSYVVAGAWSAGFGSMGWWTLSQVTAAKAPLVGIASVIWIHAMAATPVAFLLLSIGLRHGSASTIELSKLDGGLSIQLGRGIWPKWSTWCIGTFFLVAAWVSQDMVVTNLFQVVTLTEQSYLDQIADAATWNQKISACSLSIGLGIVGVIALCRSWLRDQRERFVGSPSRNSIGPDVLRILIGAFIVVLVVGIPLANLVIKAGWLATELEPGVIRRSWSSLAVLRNLGQASIEYAEEWGWSLSLAGWSATIASLVALLGVSIVLLAIQNQSRVCSKIDVDSFPRWTSIVFAILFVCFALPGPIVSGLVIDLFDWPLARLSWLRDHTLAAPILCLQFRLIPLAFFAFSIMHRRWQDRVGELWKIDYDKTWSARARVYSLAMIRPALAIWGILFVVAFGDLSTYLPCLPPGVTPISMRIFDLLHYGVRSSEAGLLLFLAIIGAAIGGLMLTMISNRR